MRYVIIGNSAAGTAAVKGIRAHDSKGEILMLARDGAPFSRPQLPLVAASKKEPDAAGITKPDWERDNQVTMRTHTTVTHLDPSKKTLTLLGGETLTYDKLLLATGSRAAFPPVEGLPGARTFALKHLQDALCIRDALPTARNVAILGAGLIGVELASYLAEAGKKTTVVEMAPYPLPMQLEETTGAMMLERMARGGVETLCGDCVVALERKDDGTPLGLALASGRLVEADLVICAAGVRRNIELALTAGIPCGRGIHVDRFCRTGVEDIFAAGDAVEITDEAVPPAMNNAIWACAVKMGTTAGAAMAGTETALEGDTGLRVMSKLFDTTIVSIGSVCPPSPDWEKAVEKGEDGTQVLYTEEGILRAAILYGNTQRAGACLKAVASGTPLTG